MLLNDVHCHFFSSRFFELLSGPLPRFEGADRVGRVCEFLGWEAPGSPEELADRWVGELDRFGVGKASLIASVPGDEDSVAAAVRRHPDRFVGFFLLDPTSEGARARVDRALSEKDMRGVCLFPAMHRYRVDDPRVLEILEVAAAHRGVLIFVHCGVLSVGVRNRLGLPSHFDIRCGNPLDLQPVALRFPTLPFLIPHFGAGFFREALMTASLCPNLRFDTSSSNSWVRFCGLTLEEAYRMALDVVGPDRLLFGSDSSFFPRGWNEAVYRTQREVLEKLQVSEEDRSKIFGGNFERLLGE